MSFAEMFAQENGGLSPVEALREENNRLRGEVERLRTENAALSAPIDVKRGDMRMMLNPARRDVVEHHIGSMMERAAAATAALAEVERQKQSKLKWMENAAQAHAEVERLKSAADSAASEIERAADQPWMMMRTHILKQAKRLRSAALAGQEVHRD